MLTPKNLATLKTLVSQEQLNLQQDRKHSPLDPSPKLDIPTEHTNYNWYLQKALSGEKTPFGEFFWINRNGKVEISFPESIQGFPAKLLKESLAKILTLVHQNQIPIGEGTKIWLGNLLKNPSLRDQISKLITPKQKLSP